MFTKLTWVNWTGTWLTGYPTFQVSVEVYFLVGPRILEYLGELEKKRICPHL